MTMSEATRISERVRKKVRARDSIDGAPCCIYCGSPYGIQIAHYVPRSQGGMGVESNLACMCVVCHSRLDNGNDPKEAQRIKDTFKWWLEENYPGWTEEDQIYRKDRA